MDEHGGSSVALRRLVALLGGLVLALGAGLAWVLTRPPVVALDDPAWIDAALERPEVKAAAVDELVRRGEGVWDSYADPDVGRVLQANVHEREFRGVRVSSNAFGMREAPYELDKPSGTTRIVLLGDSFVFGYKVEAAERLGVHLAAFLEERGAGPVECLHLAASSWNLRAEAAYLRRQLHRLRPDLVVHVTVVNDLDDLQGARGFGGMGAFSPQERTRADGLVAMLSPARLWPRRVPNYYLDALDDESRSAYARAAADVTHLAEAVEAFDGRYLLLGAWEGYNTLVRERIAGGLRDEQVAFVASTFTQDLRFRIDAQDRHWNPAGHRRMATLLYGLIRERGLLPRVTLATWDEAESAVREIAALGAREAAATGAFTASLVDRARRKMGPAIDFASLRQVDAKQVHGGIDAEGHVAPYASLILANPGAGELRLAGRRFPRSLVHGTTRIEVEEHLVAEFPLAGPEAFEERWPLPEDVRERPFLTVRFRSADFAYTDPERGRCAAFAIGRIALE